MKSISLWAKRNPWSARACIASIYILLPVLAWLMQIGLARFDISTGSWLLPSALFTFLLITLLYPLGRKNNYRNRKAFDLCLSLLSFLLLILFTGVRENNVNTSSSVYAAQRYSGEPKPVKNKVSSLRKKTKWIKKIFMLPAKLKARADSYRQAAREHRMTKTKAGLLIALTCLLGTGLAMLLAAAACNIACSGTEGAAILLAVLGSGAIVLLLILVIRAIVKRYRRDNPREASASPS